MCVAVSNLPIQNLCIPASSYHKHVLAVSPVGCNTAPKLFSCWPKQSVDQLSPSSTVDTTVRDSKNLFSLAFFNNSDVNTCNQPSRVYNRTPRH